jgi:hypothetical protein
MLKDISHFKCKKQITRNEITNSQREQGSNKQTNQTLHTFYDGTLSIKKEKICLLTKTNTN